MKTIAYKQLSLLLGVIAGLFVLQSSWLWHKPEVPEELLK
jgi:cyclic lactone autoinducer peptide